MQEGLKSCMNCGICTGVCPAAEFYDYDPRRITSLVETKDDDIIYKLLCGEQIWYCGECFSCRPRCPRGNTPGYIIQALRTLSQRLGLFTHSQRGRQQLALKRSIGENIYTTGYCLTPTNIRPEQHPEQGEVWRWIFDNHQSIYPLFSPSYQKAGAGALRKIDSQTIEEIDAIFRLSDGDKLFADIERFSDEKAREMGYDGANEEYIDDIYTKLYSDER